MKKISKVRSGDVVCVDRGLYRHYGVYDNGNVIDISPDGRDNSLSNSCYAFYHEYHEL